MRLYWLICTNKHQCCYCERGSAYWPSPGHHGFLLAGGKSGRHRTLIDVIQDLEQENAEEEGSTGLSPANERPVPLDLSCAISDPVPMQEACSNASAGTEDTSDQQSHPVKLPTEAELSGNNQSMSPPPGQSTACQMTNATEIRDNNRIPMSSTLGHFSTGCLWTIQAKR